MVFGVRYWFCVFVIDFWCVWLVFGVRDISFEYFLFWLFSFIIEKFGSFILPLERLRVTTTIFVHLQVTLNIFILHNTFVFVYLRTSLGDIQFWLIFTSICLLTERSKVAKAIFAYLRKNSDYFNYFWKAFGELRLQVCSIILVYLLVTLNIFKSLWIRLSLNIKNLQLSLLSLTFSCISERKIVFWVFSI